MANETGKFSGVMNTFVPRGFVFQRHMFDTHLANQYAIWSLVHMLRVLFLDQNIRIGPKVFACCLNIK